MVKNRKIHKTFKSKPTIEGAGVHLQRAFGFGDTCTFDPFLLLDDFRNDNPSQYVPGFPWHPHRGIETITYVLRGKVAHGDSMGNHGAITAGDVQWMTAGNGILHQEMPEGDPDGRMYGFQLQANLPQTNKMMDPRYQDVKSYQIPVVTLEGSVKVRVICGEVAGMRGPVRNVVIDPQYLDITVPAKTSFTFPTPPGYTVFAQVIDGRATFCEEQDPFAYDREGSNYFDTEHDRWLGEQSRLAREKAHIESLIDHFESVIAFSPDSPEKLKGLIEECKKQKLELLTEKKALNAQISSIRVDARQQTANTNYGNYGKGDRRRIKLNKESALQPAESQKMAIKRQVTNLDQIITWLEGFN